MNHNILSWHLSCFFNFKKYLSSFDMKVYKVNDQIFHFLNIVVPEKVPRAQSALKYFCQIQLNKWYLTPRKIRRAE